MKKLKIILDGYVDTVDVYMDQEKLALKGLFPSDKVSYECAVSEGRHVLHLMKRSKAMEKGWKKNVAFRWLSLFSGVPDWTIAEVTKDAYSCSIKAAVDVEQDGQIQLALTSGGFDVTEASLWVCVEEKEMREHSDAEKRVCRSFVFPAYILMALICLAILGFAILMATGGNLIGAAVCLCIFVLMLWFFFVYCPKYQK